MAQRHLCQHKIRGYLIGKFKNKFTIQRHVTRSIWVLLLFNTEHGIRAFEITLPFISTVFFFHSIVLLFTCAQCYDQNYRTDEMSLYKIFIYFTSQSDCHFEPVLKSFCNTFATKFHTRSSSWWVIWMSFYNKFSKTLWHIHL